MEGLLSSYGNYFFVPIALIAILATYLYHTFTYWKRKNVPYTSFVNFFDRRHFARDVYSHCRSNNLKFFGTYLFTEPALIVSDLDLIKSVLVKDFQHFDSHGTYYNEEDDPMSAHLFSLDGPKWKKLRVKMTPTFTSGKMKMMFQLILECSKQLVDFVGDIDKNNAGFDCKDAFSRFTINAIGSCAFGLECGGFEKQESPFRKFGKKVFSKSFRQGFKLMFSRAFPEMARKLHVKALETDVSDFYLKIVKNTVEHREKNNISRPDFLQLLIDLKNNDSEANNSITFEELAAQSFVFFLAGFETSSSLMTFCLFELVSNVGIQEKLRNEIETVVKKHGGVITYEAVVEMSYLNCVIEETLRKYAAISILFRKCSKEYVIPNTNIRIEKATTIMIPARQIHYDPEYYPDPQVFNPERFNAENKPKIPQFAFLPFGEGPRMCIGLRFGVLQAKVGLINLLQNFRFTLNSKSKLPLQLAKHSAVTQVENKTLFLNAHKIY